MVFGIYSALQFQFSYILKLIQSLTKKIDEIQTDNQ